MYVCIISIYLSIYLCESQRAVTHSIMQTVTHDRVGGRVTVVEEISCL